MMTLNEMKLAVCEKLPELIEQHGDDTYFKHPDGIYRILNWPTEGLQVCHEAEKLLSDTQEELYYHILSDMKGGHKINMAWRATYKQRLEALCRVWFPAKFH